MLFIAVKFCYRWSIVICSQRFQGIIWGFMNTHQYIAFLWLVCISESIKLCIENGSFINSYQIADLTIINRLSVDRFDTWFHFSLSAINRVPLNRYNFFTWTVICLFIYFKSFIKHNVEMAKATVFYSIVLMRKFSTVLNVNFILFLMKWILFVAFHVHHTSLL